MNKLIFLFFIISSLVLALGILATSKDDIVFPVAELGNCQNQAECRLYCDEPANIEACLAFAEKHNLLSSEELAKAKKFRAIGAVGPGGCRSEKECETYCADINNIEECLSFAETHGLMDEKELAEAKKVSQFLKQGGRLPGNCQTKAQCDEYCGNIANIRECITFAEQAGFISPEELKEAKQVLKVLDAGLSLPGNCRSKKECDVYCQDPNNMEECVEFALAAGFIPPEEVEEVKRILPLMKAGKMPGGCRTKESCEAYCAEEANIEECMAFALEAGFMTPEEAEIFRKTGGKGPGNCRGRKECEAFCNAPENQEICFQFAKEHGLIPEEELKNIREDMERARAGLKQAPPEVVSCLKENLGENIIEEIEKGTLVPGPAIGERMRECFEMMGPPEGMMPPRGMTLPGGTIPPKGMEEAIGWMIEGMPPQLRACLEEKIKGDISEKIRKGTISEQDIKRSIEECGPLMAPPEGIMPPEGTVPPEGGTMPSPPEGTVLPEGTTSPEGMVPSEGTMPPGEIPPEGFVPSPELCSQFQSVPSCDVVPEDFRELCRQCKNQ